METMSKILESAKSLPYYSGKGHLNIYQFLEKVKIIKELAGLNDRETIMIVKLKLRGEVSDFVFAFEKMVDTWEKLEKLLKHKYGDRATRERLEQQLISCKQEEGETVTDFMSRLLRIEQKLIDYAVNDILGGESLKPEVIRERVFRQFLVGLRRHIRRFVRIRAPNTLQIALQIAQREEEWTKGSQTESIGNYVKEYRKIRCYTCRKKGHIAANCSTDTKPVV
jgi:hypothetical protein